MEKHRNNLSPSELERLSLLSEECGEVVQAISKIIRHGWNSKYDNGTTNREQLEIEIADIQLAIELLLSNNDIYFNNIENRTINKLQRINNYLYYNKFGE